MLGTLACIVSSPKESAILSISTVLDSISANLWINVMSCRIIKNQIKILEITTYYEQKLRNEGIKYDISRPNISQFNQDNEVFDS